MPFARELRGGEIIEMPYTGVRMHAESVDVVSGLWPRVTATGHSPWDGRRLTAEPPAGRFVTEVVADGALVDYHGDLIEFHGRYRILKRCFCAECEQYSWLTWYRLAAPDAAVEIEASRASFALVDVACEPCRESARAA